MERCQGQTCLVMLRNENRRGDGCPYEYGNTTSQQCVIDVGLRVAVTISVAGVVGVIGFGDHDESTDATDDSGNISSHAQPTSIHVLRAERGRPFDHLLT